jgi:CBS domain-containing protein
MGTLADVVKPDFLTVAPEDTLGEVAERMTHKNVGAVIVKDHGRLIGILTERDMLRAMAARVHTSDARVRQWMTADPITASAEMDLEEASRIMLDNGFRHLPVVEGSTVLGVVSLRRILGGRRHPAPAPEAA